MTLNVAVISPAAICTEGGTGSAVAMLLDRSTVAPPEGAALERVTSQLVDSDAASEMLAHVRELIDGGGRTAIATTFELPLRVAVRFEVFFMVTALAAAVNVAVVSPAGTVTEAGAVRIVFTLVVRATGVPPEDAGPESVTVQTVDDGPIRLILAQLRLLTVIFAVTKTVSVLLVPLRLAVMSGF